MRIALPANRIFIGFSILLLIAAVACGGSGAGYSDLAQAAYPAGISPDRAPRLTRVSTLFQNADSRLYLPSFLPEGFQLWFIEEIQRGEFETTYLSESKLTNARLTVTQSVPSAASDARSAGGATGSNASNNAIIDRIPVSRTIHHLDGRSETEEFDDLGFATVVPIDGALVFVRGVGELPEPGQTSFRFDDAIVREILGSLVPFSADSPG